MKTETKQSEDCTSALSYTERAGQMNGKARVAAFTAAGRALEKFRNVSMNIGELRVVRLNQLREAGRQFNIGCGREQLAFNLEGVEFCRKEILPLMPPKTTIEQIHACVLIANKMPEPAKTPAEVEALEKSLTPEFEMLGLVPTHKRTQLQSAHARNLFSDFVYKMAGLRVMLGDLEKEAPMETWPAEKLDQFLENAQPAKNSIARAERLRLGTGN